MSMGNELIEALETKIAFLERAITDLSDEMYQQSQHLQALREQIRLLGARLDAAATTAGDAPLLDERPPHY
jgi:uncharacterized coiled-coil protein SlyX